MFRSHSRSVAYQGKRRSLQSQTRVWIGCPAALYRKASSAPRVSRARNGAVPSLFGTSYISVIFHQGTALPTDTGHLISPLRPFLSVAHWLFDQRCQRGQPTAVVGNINVLYTCPGGLTVEAPTGGGDDAWRVVEESPANSSDHIGIREKQLLRLGCKATSRARPWCVRGDTAAV